MPIRDYTLTYTIDATGAAQGFAVLDAGYKELIRNTYFATKDTVAFETQLASLVPALNAAAHSMSSFNAQLGAAAAGHIHIGDNINSSTKAVHGFNGGLLASAAAFQGLALGIETIGELGQKIADVRQKTVEMAEATMQLRGEMRELANLKGHDGPDDEVVAGTVEFGLKSAMTPKEAAAFMGQYLGSNPAGLQKGNIGGGRLPNESQEEYEKRVQPISDSIAQAGARFGQRVGLQPATAGDISGVMSQFEQIGSGEEASQKWGQIAYGLNEGRGKLEPLMRVLANTAGAIVEEDGGAVGSLTELSVMLGLSSTHHAPASAGTYVKKASREIRQAAVGKGEAAENVRGMGVLPEDSTMEAIKKMAPHIAAAQAQGMTVDNFLRTTGFKDEAAIQAISEAYLDLPLYEQRMANAQKITGKDVETKNRNFFTRDLAGIRMQQNSTDEVSKYLRGNENEKINIARQAAVTRLRDAGALNSTELQFADKVSGGMGIDEWLGMPSAFSARVDEEARNFTLNQMRNAGMDAEADAYQEKIDKLGGGNLVSQAKNRAQMERLTTNFYNHAAPKLIRKGINPFSSSTSIGMKIHDLARPESEKELRRQQMGMNPNAPKTPVDAGPDEDEVYARQTREATERESNPLNFLNPFFWPGEVHHRLIERKERLAKQAPLMPDENGPTAGFPDPVLVNPPLRQEVLKQIRRNKAQGNGQNANTNDNGYPAGSDEPARYVPKITASDSGKSDRLEQLLTALLDETRNQHRTIRDGNGMPLPETFSYGPMRA